MKCIHLQAINLIYGKKKKPTTLCISDQPLSWSKNNFQVDRMKNNDYMKQDLQYISLKTFPQVWAVIHVIVSLHSIQPSKNIFVLSINTVLSA